MRKLSLALVAVAACSKSSAQGIDLRLAAVLPAKVPAQLASWDLTGRARAWQGARVMEQSAGLAVAIEVTAAAARTWDGHTERQFDFQLESPCSATLIEHARDGSSSSTTTHFTVRAGKLMAGLGDAGSRDGASAVACIANQTLTLDDAGTCLAWESRFDRWQSSPASCGFAQRDGKEVFVAGETTLLVDGEALLSEQLAHGASIGFPDYAVAKRARDQK